MIDEMKQENLSLLHHVSETSKSSLEYNIFVVKKFLVKQCDTVWWKRLKNEEIMLTPNQRIKSQYTKLYRKIKEKVSKILRFKH